VALPPSPHRAAGVMITASQTAQTRLQGYLGNGAQIVPPADEAISTLLAEWAAGPSPLGAVPANRSASTSWATISPPSSALPPSVSHDINTVYTPFTVSAATCCLPGF